MKLKVMCDDIEVYEFEDEMVIARTVRENIRRVLEKYKIDFEEDPEKVLWQLQGELRNVLVGYHLWPEKLEEKK